MSKISVITVVKDNLEGLIHTINSIQKQDFFDWEVIIIDGGNSIEVYDYINKLNDIRFILKQGPDKGIYDAMNKGIACSKGEILNFLNTGDLYLSSNVLTLVNLSSMLIQERAPYMIKGLARTLTKTKPERLNYISLMRRCPNHQSVFYHRDCFKKLYNNKYKLISDWAHFFENLNRIKIIYIDLELINYKGGGVADNIYSHLVAWKERFMHSVFYSNRSIFFRAPFSAIAILGIIYSRYKILVHELRK
jgi:glycosyltransferase involved in cell wall biosynthesis